MFIPRYNVISELPSSQPIAARSAQMNTREQSWNLVSHPGVEQGILVLERRMPPQNGALRTWLAGVRGAFEGTASCLSQTIVTITSLHVPNLRSDETPAVRPRPLMVSQQSRATHWDLVNTGAPLLSA
jgi:hypothetical protein